MADRGIKKDISTVGAWRTRGRWHAGRVSRYNVQRPVRASVLVLVEVELAEIDAFVESDVALDELCVVIAPEASVALDAESAVRAVRWRY